MTLEVTKIKPHISILSMGSTSYTEDFWKCTYKIYSIPLITGLGSSPKAAYLDYVIKVNECIRDNQKLKSNRVERTVQLSYRHG